MASSPFVLSTDHRLGTDIDESELEAELLGLEDEWAEEEATAAAAEATPSYLAPTTHEMPAAPSGVPERQEPRRVDAFGLPVGL
jgi:hypothetical protein